MAKKNSKTKITNNIDSKQTSITDYIRYIYLAFVFTVYLVITHDKYFDITKTRCNTFTLLSLGFIILAAVGLYLDAVLSKSRRGLKDYIGKMSFKNPILWMLAFLFCNFLSFVMAPNGRTALNGENGRFMGFYMYIILVLVMILLAIGMEAKEWIFALFLVTSFFSFVVAIFQQIGNDFLKLREGIKKDQIKIFISTFGNINIFATFVVIAMAVAVCTCIFSNKPVFRIIAGIDLVAGGICLMITNSDSAYVGFFAISVFVCFAAIRDGYFIKLLLAYNAIALGNLFAALINTYAAKNRDKREGIARMMENPKLAAVVFVACVIVLLVAISLKGKFENINRKRLSILFVVFVIVMLAVIIFVGNRKGISMFVFNDDWGTYRGFIWRKAVEIYNNSSFAEKIFGHGQETVKGLTVSYCYEDMIKLTKKVYDNVHNELLQYLLTIGLAGVVAYVGMVVSALIYIFKNRNNSVAYISMAVIIGYLAQSLINLNQPITTPLFFVVLGIGVGCANIKQTD